MKINLVIDIFYPQTGGQQFRFYELLECFLIDGHEVEVFTVAHEESLPLREELSNGIIINRIVKDSGYYKNGVFGRKLSTYLKFSFLAKKYLKNNEGDMIIFDQFSFLTAILYNSKTVFTVLDFVEFRKSIIWKIINKRLLRSTNKIVCISKYLKEEVDQYLKDKSRTVLIPSLVQTEKYYFSKSEEEFGLFIGRVESHKHPELAVSSVIEYNRKNNTNLKLKIAGGGSILKNLQSAYKDNSVVSFLGYIEDNEKYELLSKAKFLILPSEREGLPKSFIEAVSSELPIVTINYTENYGRYFVEENKVGEVASGPEDLSTAIEKIINNRDFYKNNCKNIIKDYDLINGAKQYLKLVKK
ncbi:hypothetical protein AWE51_22305 [Aquimarina aggregata]|uniref:Glycosyl transferase family 1 domain-containing protein n=1 Tax=Aquimarina aggregata TaxID=1642818 RepID=A0A162DJM3_9FLAO|nr:glycosyltransferase family 4 protein [Aquimarina aggregata]KZS41438.1 hypothetical protein AWE51_22305 [Aquimarina aggregata]